MALPALSCVVISRCAVGYPEIDFDVKPLVETVILKLGESGHEGELTRCKVPIGIGQYNTLGLFSIFPSCSRAKKREHLARNVQ